MHKRKYNISHFQTPCRVPTEYLQSPCVRSTSTSFTPHLPYFYQVFIDVYLVLPPLEENFFFSFFDEFYAIFCVFATNIRIFVEKVRKTTVFFFVKKLPLALLIHTKIVQFYHNNR